MVLLLFPAIAGCGSNQYASDNIKADGYSGYAPYPGTAAEPEEGWYGGYDDDGSFEKPAYERLNTATEPAADNDKIIYYYNASVETVRFDETLEAIDALIERYNAFIESSSVTGSNYNSYDYGRSYRTAGYVIRVPKESFKQMTEEISSLGNLTYGNMQAQNITSQFIDTQSRLNAYRIEESRLLSMLEKAETVADMITIETRLSEVRYNIESLTTMLNNWTMQIDYSTVNLTVSEVKELTPEVTIPRTLGEEIGDALGKTFKGILNTLRNLLIVFIAVLPVLAVIAVILLIILLIVKTVSKRKRKKLPHLNAYNEQNQIPPDGRGQG